MPYIKDYNRGQASTDPVDSGELNYALTLVCKDYLDRMGECYKTYNDILGALEGCKLELYRRKVAPYENIKIEQNGDVY